MKKYDILITPLERTGGRTDAPYQIQLETDNIDWSMEQYQRNRPALDWKIVNED
jgi:hypothetical protein